MGTPLNDPRLPELDATGADTEPASLGFMRRLVRALWDQFRLISGAVREIRAGLSSKLDASSYTAADVLTKIKTVDGSGSGLDADTLDGINSTGFVATSNGIAEDLTVRSSLVLDNGVEITADWSNATTASRAYLQTKTANSATGIPILPSGTGTATAIRLYNNSAPASGQYVSLAAGSTSVSINSAAESGTPKQFLINVNGKQAVTVDANGNVQIGGNNAVLATTATTDFMCIPTCNGAPTGAFTPPTGYAGMVVDTSASGAGGFGRLYLRFGGNWRYIDITG